MGFPPGWLLVSCWNFVTMMQVCNKTMDSSFLITHWFCGALWHQLGGKSLFSVASLWWWHTCVDFVWFFVALMMWRIFRCWMLQCNACESVNLLERRQWVSGGCHCTTKKQLSTKMCTWPNGLFGFGEKKLFVHGFLEAPTETSDLSKSEPECIFQQICWWSTVIHAKRRFLLEHDF